MLTLKTCGLHLGEAAIDKQLRPRHVARIIRCEKHYCFGDLIRLSEPAERDYIREHLQPLGIPGERERDSGMMPNANPG
jgi:hypothetical protein